MAVASVTPLSPFNDLTTAVAWADWHVATPLRDWELTVARVRWSFHLRPEELTAWIHPATFWVMTRNRNPGDLGHYRERIAGLGYCPDPRDVGRLLPAVNDLFRGRGLAGFTFRSLPRLISPGRVELHGRGRALAWLRVG
jgi:hypothetical protein